MSEDTFGYCLTGTTIFFVASTVPFVYYGIAERNVESAWREYGRFVKDQPTLKKLERALWVEARRWPMYARPVYYTSVDQSAHVLFANAERALYQARNIEKRLQAAPPERTMGFKAIFFSQQPSAWLTSIGRLASFNFNTNRLEISRMIQTDVKDYENSLREAMVQLRMLNRSHRQEDALHETTRAALEKLEKRLEEVGNRQKKHSHEKKFEESLDWAQKNTQNCCIEARNQLQLQGCDGINFAIADIYIRLANSILDHFDLYEREFSVPVRFELDHFKLRHEAFKKYVNEILQAHSIDNWQKLYLTECMLVLSYRKIQQSSRSLNNFMERYRKLTTLEEKFPSVDFQSLQAEALQIEKNCESYWGPVDLDPTFWKKSLEAMPVPHSNLDDAQRKYQGDIFPSIGPGLVIKQTQLNRIILDIEIFFRGIEAAKLGIRKLTIELDTHKAAQIEVGVRLGAGGTAYQKVRDLVIIEEDTSSEIQRECISCRKEFDIYQARARRVQGANFPSMLGELDKFETECTRVRQKHTTAIRDLQSQYYGLIQQLITVRGNLVKLRNGKPRIEYDVSPTIQKAELSVNTYSRETDSYRELLDYISQTRQIMEVAKKDQEQLEKTRQEFVNVENETRRKLEETRQTFEEHNQYSLQAWAWARKPYEKWLGTVRKSYEKYLRELDKISNLDIPIRDAIGICQRIELDMNHDLENVLGKLDEIRDQQQEFFDKRYELERSITPTIMFSRIPSRDSELINKFCVEAENAPSKKGVELALDMAQKLLEKNVTREEAEAAIRIINNQGTYIEEQVNESGSSAWNAGRDIS